MLPPAALEFYALQQRVSATAANEVRRLWRLMGDDFDASWRRYGPSILAVMVEAQQVMAEAAAEYVPAVLNQTDLADRPMGQFQPDSLVGIASDGRPIESLAYGSVIEAKTAIGTGASTTTGLTQGGNWLDLMVKLQVADTARQAVGVMTATRKNLGGYVRVLNPPSCQRCAILAGRVYRWSTGFDRHPRDDCTMLPAESAGWAEAEGFLTDPMDAYRKGEIKDLTQAQIAAIENGADIGQVVNAYRGMSTTALTTQAGVTTRGIAGKRLGNFAKEPGRRYPVSQTPRLTPEAIYQLARGDRAEAISMLRRYGFIL